MLYAMWSLIAFSLFAVGAVASPIGDSNGLTYHNLDARKQNLPTLALPYGTWQASSYDKDNDFYIFKNIRFAAPPVGNLRWQKPQPPIPNSTLQDGSYGPACIQGDAAALLGGGTISTLLSLASSLGIDVSALISGSSETSEDCLFLDIYVPSKALSGQTKLPVVNWIYGGGYLIGSKEGMYVGSPIVKASGGTVIYIGANYRLGAFGWLAGTTVENGGTPNAALWDQQAALQWIQTYGDLFGADTNNVSVWGESAGAGSINHHLTAFGGTQPALFKTAVIQSPAYDPQIDRKGQLESQFQNFSALAGCGGQGLDCLRKADVNTLKTAQDKYTDQMPGGKPGWGPAVDGSFVRKLPEVEMSAGNVVKGIDTMIVSHVYDEAALFVPSTVNDSVIEAVIDHFWGTSPTTADAIRARYLTNTSYPDDKARIHQLYQFATFTCHVRWITEGFAGQTYNVQYSRGNGIHGSDIAADFYDSSSLSLTTIEESLIFGADLTLGTFAPTYQAYMLSLAKTGDPNTYKSAGTPQWPKVTIGPTLTNVMNATEKSILWELIADQDTKAEDCDWWKDVLTKMSQEFATGS